VRETARALGTTTEEASRLIQVADDVTISTGSMTTAFKLALKNGFTPTIDGLSKMSDEYLRLAPGTERAQFLLDRFGKSGMEMGKLLDLGSAAIKRQSAAVEASLIITQRAVDEQRKYEIAVDSLGDSWKAFTYQVMPPVVTGLTAVMNSVRDSTRAQQLAREAGIAWSYENSQLTNGFMKQAAAEREVADANLAAGRSANEASAAFETETEKAKILSDGQKVLQDALDATTKANQGMINTIQSMQDMDENYTNKVKDLADQRVKALADGDLVALEKIKQAEIDLGIERDKQTLQFISNILLQKLELGGLTDAEFEAFAKQQEAWGLWSADVVAKAQAAWQEADRVAASIAAIESQKVFIDVWTTHYETWAGGQPAASPMRAHASGGSFLIPQSYGNEGFRMGNGDTASGGETVTITPQGMGSNSGQIDYNKLARVLRDAIMQAG
jgi:hypothetical protein